MYGINSMEVHGKIQIVLFEKKISHVHKNTIIWYMMVDIMRIHDISVQK